MGAELIWKEPVYAKAVEALLAPLTADAFTHAEGILAGKTYFRNTLSKVLSAQAKACRDELAKNPRMKGAAVLLKITTGLNRDEVLEFAWRRFVGRLWRRTLGGVSRELGYERGGGLSDATSPQDILRYFWRDEEPVEDPMKKEMVVTSNLPESEHRKVWRGSRREMKGTFHEILSNSRLHDAAVKTGGPGADVKVEYDG